MTTFPAANRSAPASAGGGIEGKKAWFNGLRVPLRPEKAPTTGDEVAAWRRGISDTVGV
jgi:hypothetical protein